MIYATPFMCIIVTEIYIIQLNAADFQQKRKLMKCYRSYSLIILNARNVIGFELEYENIRKQQTDVKMNLDIPTMRVSECQLI